MVLFGPPLGHTAAHGLAPAPRSLCFHSPCMGFPCSWSGKSFKGMSRASGMPAQLLLVCSCAARPTWLFMSHHESLPCLRRRFTGKRGSSSLPGGSGSSPKTSDCLADLSTSGLGPRAIGIRSHSTGCSVSYPPCHRDPPALIHPQGSAYADRSPGHDGTPRLAPHLVTCLDHLPGDGELRTAVGASERHRDGLRAPEPKSSVRFFLKISSRKAEPALRS